MDRRKAWREQEELLVSRWTAANERHRVALSEFNASGPSDERRVEVEAARAEVESLRREVARLKVEFSQGRRY